MTCETLCFNEHKPLRLAGGNDHFSSKVILVITSRAQELCVSSISSQEVGIKRKIGLKKVCKTERTRTLGNSCL